MYSDGSYLRAHPTWHEEDSPWKARQVLRMVQAHGLSPKRLCEVGCGAGGVLAALQPSLQDCNFLGLDISPDAIELARAKSGPRLNFEVGSLPSAHHDLLLMLDVVEHVEDYYGFLRSAREHADLKILHIPLDISVQTVLRVSPILGNRASAGHVHYFTRELALLALRDASYQVLDWFYTAGGVEIEQQTAKRRFARLPRKVAFALSPDLAARVLGGFSLLVLAR